MSKEATPAADEQPLVAPTAPAAEKKSEWLKYGSLGFLILQNSSHVVLLR